MNASLLSTVNGRLGRWLPAALVLALSIVLAPWRLAANPSHPVTKQGSATFSTQGSQLTIKTTTANTLINWSSFNIGAGQSTVFIEPSSTSVVWNHISDPNPTQILGHLDANGYVVLQNQSGFYIGGNAVLNAAGLLMTTTPVIPADVFGGGAWDFTAPPPTAKIVNYGEINAGPAGSVFLISHDIVNNGTITAPGGNIGLCAGQKVLVSTRADGRGLSAEVTLPKGSVDNSGRLIADAGTIALNAQVVNQGGLIQANSVREQNGVIDILASDSVTLGPASTISAKGDSQDASAGGQVTVKGGNTFSDAAGSVIDVSGGAQGGAGGQVEISAKDINSIQSQINGQAESGWTGGKLVIDPQNIVLSSSGSTATSGTVNKTDPPAAGTLTLNPATLNSFSQILLQASGNITLSTAWTVPDSATPTTLTLQAGNNIIFNSSLAVGQNWTLNLIAGANFSSPIGLAPAFTDVTPVARAGASSIILAGTAGLTSANGNINLLAGGVIQTASGAIQSTAGRPVLLQSMFPTSANTPGISVGTMNLPDTATPTSFTMQAIGNITVTGGITAGQNWSLNLLAGATFTPATANTPASVSVNNSSSSSVALTGSAVLQTQNEDIDITSANAVSVSPNVGSTGAIRTMGGGSIDVVAGGNVNTGQNNNGYSFKVASGGVSSSLGGISTAAGGNVTINAGGNVTSYLPSGTVTTATSPILQDAGSGAFGPEPGVVTITAGGSVYGHYVAANSPTPSIITAGANAGSAGSTSSLLALSLVTGSWVVNATSGSINLQEVRNPNGVLQDTGGIFNNPLLNNVFNYDPSASVTLNAPNGAVNLTGTSVPRYSSAQVPCIYPPSLTINAGPGGVSLGAEVILFPSPDGQLTVNTIVPIGTPPNAPGTPPPGSFEGNGKTLVMSDSAATRWISGATFDSTDHAPTPVQLNNPQPVVFNIAGNLDDVALVTPKETQVTVGGNLDNFSFTGQNLHSSDVSFFHVAGEIFNQNTYTFFNLSAPLSLPPALYPGDQQNYLQLLTDAVLPGSSPASAAGGTLLPGLNLFYLPATQQLGYYGQMDAATEALFLGTLYEKTYSQGGQILLNPDGTYKTTTATLPSGIEQAILALYTASQNSINVASAPQGIVIGGPGQLDIIAKSMDLGAATQGISSQGPNNNHFLANIAAPGATININVTGDLDMYASIISSWYGGAININVGGSINAGLGALPFQGYQPNGIWTSSDSDVTIIAQGNINVNGSRIAAYDGGNIFVESLGGNVNAGSGNLNQILVNEVVVNPKTGAVSNPLQPIAGSGILTTTVQDAPRSLPVGDITVLTPNGDIDAQLGGITQEPQNRNSSFKGTLADYLAARGVTLNGYTPGKFDPATIAWWAAMDVPLPDGYAFPKSPTVTLTAGTFGPDGKVIHVGNIDAGNTGVIAINSNIKATGKVTGLFISSGNSTIYGNTLNVTDLAGQTATVSAAGSITGTIIAGGGISVGAGTFSGVALSQNVSGGGASSSLASAATATASSQNAAAGESNLQKAQTSDQPATDADDEKKRAHPRPLLAKFTGRVTVLLPPKL